MNDHLTTLKQRLEDFSGTFFGICFSQNAVMIGTSYEVLNTRCASKWVL